MKKLQLLIILTTLSSAFAWTLIYGGSHHDSCWTPLPGDSISGSHTEIDTFHLTSMVPIKHHDGANFGFLEIEANVVIIEGTLEATSAGYSGGAGGPSFGRGNGYGGHPGEPGEGPAGGCAGEDGERGERDLTWPGGRFAGGGGGGGSRGGGYGGISCIGGSGGEGQGVWRAVIHTAEADGGAGGSGGSGSGDCPGGIVYQYGSTHGMDINMGSGGGGGGSGGNNGNGVDYIPGRGDDGFPGGNGGGMVKITADSIYVSGVILVDGSNGGDGGKGGDSRDCSEGEGPGGGGGAAGGGSGGGILLYAQKMILTETAFLSAKGGNGGNGGDLGNEMTGSPCLVEAYGGTGGDGGSGGGGGRIKKFHIPSLSSLEGTFSIDGGSGGSGGAANAVPSSSMGSAGCDGMNGTISERQIGSVIITTNLPTEISDSVFVSGIIRPAPHQVFIAPGDSIHIAAAYPPNPCYIGGTRYNFTFTGWDCGGDSARWVLPITSDTMFVAQFDVEMEFFCSIMKDPLADIVGSLFVDSDTFVATESDSQSFWWSDGSVHSIGVSAIDSVDLSRKWRFVSWSDGGPIIHNTSPITSSRYFIADYIAQLHVSISKDPAVDTFGFISYDIDTFWGAASVFQECWWDSGSIHPLIASSIDTIGCFNRYQLRTFSDGYDSSHFTEPILEPTDFIAFYDKQHMCRIRKSPSSDVFGSMIIDSDTLVGAESAGTSRWWNHGSTHYVETSAIDSVDSTERYSWDSWSDGFAIGHTTAAIDTPCTLTAFYWRELKVTIEKNPASDSCGWLALDADTIWGSESVSQTRWWHFGSLHNVGVSTPDFCGDSLYHFDHWSEPSMDTCYLINIVSDTVFFAHYIGSIPHIEIWISDTVWEIDTMLAGDMHAMVPGDEIAITNLSDVYIVLGLAITDSADWRTGIYPDENRFSLRARFEDGQPVSFDPFEDAVRPEPHDMATETRFGSGGYGLNFSPPDTSLMWLEFLAPMPGDSTSYGPKVLKINLMARQYME